MKRELLILKYALTGKGRERLLTGSSVFLPAFCFVGALNL